MDELRDQFDRKGFAVLRGAAPAEALEAYPAEIDALREGLLVRAPGDEHVSLAGRAEPGRAGEVDPYALSDAARAILLPEPVVAALAARFDGAAPLLFDAAQTAAGAPDPGPYRDATYVAVSAQPEALVTLVVALGAAPAHVAVRPGSHRLATAPFSGRYRHFNPERDGDAALQRHRDELTDALAGLDEEGETIALEPGDVAFWHADLVHEAPQGPALIAHVCPTSAQPSWFAYRPERARLAAVGAAWIASQHYDLLDAVDPAEAPVPEPPGAPEPARAPDLERVEEGMRAHDDRPPDAPAPPPPHQPPPGRRTGGGIVDAVRGLMGRRGGR
jgi:hypothetical protein